MSNTGKCLRGELFYKNNDGEWIPLGEVTNADTITYNNEFTYTRNQLEAEQRITKKQAKRLLKYEKNPMARRELQRIISAKEY